VAGNGTIRPLVTIQETFVMYVSEEGPKPSPRSGMNCWAFSADGIAKKMESFPTRKSQRTEITEKPIDVDLSATLNRKDIISILSCPSLDRAEVSFHNIPVLSF
jgi:hypothetical protein